MRCTCCAKMKGLCAHNARMRLSRLGNPDAAQIGVHAMSMATLDTPQVEPSESLIAELRDALQVIPPAECPSPDRRADYTAREVADLSGLSMATIRREVRLGRLAAVRDGRRASRSRWFRTSAGAPLAAARSGRAGRNPRRKPLALGGAPEITLLAGIESGYR